MNQVLLRSKAALGRMLGRDRLRTQLEIVQAERDAYLIQRDIALGERNAYLIQRDIALGERNEFVCQLTEARTEVRQALQSRRVYRNEIECLVGLIHEAIPHSSMIFFHAVDYARVKFRDAVMDRRASLEDALLGVKLINLLIAKHEYQLGSIATTARPVGFMLDPANQCHLGCPSCTNSYNREFTERTYNQWPRGLMTAETFDTFSQQVGLYAFNGHFYNNHEPLLNKLTPSFVRKATDMRVRTFISSNLSYRKVDAEAIVASGLTELMVAADGVTQPVYERYRKGGNIEWVLDNARALVEAKRKMKSMTPVLRWQFLSFAHNVHELPAAIAVTKEIGFDTFNVATPLPVNMDDPSIDTIEYDGQKHFEFRPRQSMPFTGSLEPYRDMIEAALSESAMARWQAETDGREESHENGSRCDWLNLAVISDAGGRIVPCCKGDVRDIGRFVFADIASDGRNIMNTDAYREARKVLATAERSSHSTYENDIVGYWDMGGTTKDKVICVNCPVRPLPQVGLGAVASYVLDTPTLASMEHLHNWSRHVTYRDAVE